MFTNDRRQEERTRKIWNFKAAIPSGIEPNERLVEFGVGGICNCCPDPANAALINQCGGIPLVIQCLSSPVRNTVNYAIGSLYYLCNASNKEEIMKPEVVDVMRDMPLLKQQV
ncbi:hypothetical protein M0R45_025807 [Rubus argutus]|uniref:Uncharacterized protein n=1 Tax=Rubus argutus TaxID=59490 RepID=A0AAW1WX35_RUBAR